MYMFALDLYCKEHDSNLWLCDFKYAQCVAIISIICNFLLMFLSCKEKSGNAIGEVS